MSTTSLAKKKGHICPPSDAADPADRWETMFVYAFIYKFTNLRAKTEGFETAMDLETALKAPGPDPVLCKVLQHFILNMRPQTRTLSVDQISTTVAGVLADYTKTPERTVFWDEDLNANVDPLANVEGGIFSADWDLKLRVLRQLVESQLAHSAAIKTKIDRAWGVMQQKTKKKDADAAPPESDDANSLQSLQVQPLGQDLERKRYWAVDDSPRLYVSTNPWKITSTLRTIASSREEYMALIEQLKAASLQLTDKKAKSRKGQHDLLVETLESRVEAIDRELARIARVRRKIEQRQIALAQAEVRSTRTRRQTRRPEYVYNDVESDDGGDEYQFEEDNDYDDEAFGDDLSSNHSNRRRAEGTRRSSRATKGRRVSRSPDGTGGMEWGAERRSTRLGPPEQATSSRKRARTEDSVTSSSSYDVNPSIPTERTAAKVARTNGAAAVRPTEVAVEQVAGKKKSRYWFYAVEPIPAPSGEAPIGANGDDNPNSSNGHLPNSNGVSNMSTAHLNEDAMDVDSNVDVETEGSLPPASSVE